MTSGNTYIVVCRQGKNKNECPLVVQQGWACVECTMAGYILREKIKQTEQTEQTEQNDI